MCEDLDSITCIPVKAQIIYINYTAYLNVLLRLPTLFLTLLRFWHNTAVLLYPLLQYSRFQLSSVHRGPPPKIKVN
jgi:hypothetical protein